MQNEEKDARHHKVIASDTPPPPEHDNAWHCDSQSPLSSPI
jgi:hypothetical protein